jgi:hypothetical protein
VHKVQCTISKVQKFFRGNYRSNKRIKENKIIQLQINGPNIEHNTVVINISFFYLQELLQELYIYGYMVHCTYIYLYINLSVVLFRSTFDRPNRTFLGVFQCDSFFLQLIPYLIRSGPVFGIPCCLSFFNHGIHFFF